MYHKFKFRNIVAFFAAFLLALAVMNKPNSANIPPNTLVLGNRGYRIIAGLEEIYKPKDNHYFSRFNITDGKFYSTKASVMGNYHPIWRARDNSFWLYVDLYAPPNNYRVRKFTYAPSDVDVNDPSVAQRFFFKKGRFFFDVNRNGSDESEEFFDVVNGVISVSGASPNYTFSFDLLLENGVRTAGTFSSRFIRV